MFFLASMGISQAHEQAVMNYWWVRPEEAPAHAARVIRVLGEKGERFEDVYTLDRQTRLENSPVVMQARLQRQEMLRREAMALVKKLKAEGKSPLVAYEEAWTRVYKNRWLTANWQLGSSKLEDMLLRMSGENQSELTAEEQQWVLEALLENDDRLETEAGRELLRRLTQRLRALGYGKFYSPNAANDQVMKRFADALSTGMDSMAAYREAMFTTHRDRVGQHTLRGYVAPWGIRVGGPRYHQAPQKVGTTEGSASGLDAVLAANPQPGNQLTAPDLNGVSAAEKDFLASSHENEKKEKDEEDEKKKEQEDELVQQGTSAAGAAPAASSSAPAPRLRMAMRAVAPVAAAGETVPSLPQATMTELWNAADLKLTDGDEASIHVDRSPTSLYGNLSWSRVNNWSSNYQWSGGDEIESNKVRYYDSIGLSDNNHLYLGTGNNVSIVVNGEGNYLHAEGESNRRPVAGSGLFTYNMLQGQGELTLMADKASTTSGGWWGSQTTTYYTTIYSFSGTPAEDEGFYGTLRFAASREASVQLNLSGEHWKNTEFDMTRGGGPGYDVTNSNAQARSVVLNLTGDTQILGLSGGDRDSTVTSNSRVNSHTLTLGSLDASASYTYKGTFNGNYYTNDTTTATIAAPLNLTKVYGNTQIMTLAATGNNAFNILTAAGGVLQFNGNVQSALVRAQDGGDLVVGGNLNVTETYAETQELQVSGEGSRLLVTGDITVTDDMSVSSGGSLSGANLTVKDKLSINGGSVEIKGSTSAQAVTVTGGGWLHTQHLSDSRNDKLLVEVGSQLTAGEYDRSTLTVTGDFRVDTLRLRSDARLVTGDSSNSISESHLHGGAEWVLEGTQNMVSGLTKIENAAGGIKLTSGTGSTAEGGTVLTMQGVISFADADWTDRETAVFILDGVTLDFSRELTLTNLGFAFDETDHTFVLAQTTGNGGWFNSAAPSVIVQSGNHEYHANLLYGEDDGLIYVSLEHELGSHAYEVANGHVVYLQMYQNAADPALPYLAYTDAAYDSEWRGTGVAADHLLQFAKINLNGGGHVYLGEDLSGDAYAAHRHFGGRIVLQNPEDGAASVHGTIDSWGNWILDGRLGGSGTLNLVAHHGIGNTATEEMVGSTAAGDMQRLTTTWNYGTASTFTFTDASSSWMNGTVHLAANAGTSKDEAGGIVQLNIGNVNIAGKGDTRWQNVVVDLTIDEENPYADPDSVNTTSGNATELVLGVMGDATVAGLDGSAESSVVSDVPGGSMRPSPTLTVGSDGANHTFAGTLGSGNFYTGGAASHKETVVNTYGPDPDGGDSSVLVSSEKTSSATNMVRMGDGKLSLTKVGSNTQTFSGSSNLDSVTVQGGKLALTGATHINDLTLAAGTTLQTGNSPSVEAATIYGGSTWQMGGNTDLTSTVVTLADMTGSSVSITGSGTWTTMQQLTFTGDSSCSNTTPLFMLGGNVTLNMNNALTLNNVQGIATGDIIALYGGVSSNPLTLGDKHVLVIDADGNEYETTYSYSGNTVYLEIGQNAGSGIKVDNFYTWSGEKAGYVDGSNQKHLGITMGNVWRADGSAAQTGWHEQRVKGVASGVYVNGYGVAFMDEDVHEKDETDREVYIYGKVAPGKIQVSANTDAGSMGSGDAQLKYGYALTGHVDSPNAGIIDYVDAAGNLTRTSIEKTGDAVLILNMANDFSGGMEIKDGSLYLSRPNASGTGPITLYTDCSWNDYWDKTGSNSGFATVVRTGAELMVNYEHNYDAVSAYRNPVVQNTVILKSGSGENAANPMVTISYARAAYESKNANDDFSNVPRHWRNLLITGGLYGSGSDLVLRGYTSCWDGGHDQCYISAFSINHSQLNDKLIAELGKTGDLSAFNGTVTLTNTVNTSKLDNDNVSARTAGGVQLSLQDDTFAQGKIDLTREQSDFTEKRNNKDVRRQSYTNILVVNGNVSVGALQGDFRGSAWNYTKNNNGGYNRDYGTIGQVDERWRLRVVTGSESTLHLGLEDDGQYVYSGAMGYAQSYTQPQQSHISFGDGFGKLDAAVQYNSGFDDAGTFSNGTETLSLVKSGTSTQYIHTAKLNDLSLYKGTLGFNRLELQGNLNLVDGTTLKLGVTGGKTDWRSITSTSKGVTVGAAKAPKTLTVITPSTKLPVDNNMVEVAPLSAVVEGDVFITSGSTMTFISSVVPDSEGTDVYTDDKVGSINPLLDVKGTLTLGGNNSINLVFDNITFSTQAKYYIARADAIKIDTGDEDAFGTSTVALGYGYFGTLYTVGDKGSTLIDDKDYCRSGDYLVMQVTGDPRRTWSGMMNAENAGNDALGYITSQNYTWTNGDYTKTDYRWKENLEFQNGLVVLFGNLNQPTEWTETSKLESRDTVKVDGDNRQLGTLVETTGDTPLVHVRHEDKEAPEYVQTSFNIDGFELGSTAAKKALGDFQAVRVSGEVAPFMVMINANYEEYWKDGDSWRLENDQQVDDTNYYFYSTETGDKEGTIRDATPEELGGIKFDQDWKTMLHKTGTGTTVMALDNSYTGGSILQGGLMVMQHVNALGRVYDENTKSHTADTCTITLMNSARLQGDFDDDDFAGNYIQEGNVALGKAMATTTIANTVYVNVYTDPYTAYETTIDGVLLNSGDKKLILKKLVGESDTVLMLAGVGLTREEAESRSIERYAARNDDGTYKKDDADNYLTSSGEILNTDRFHYGVFKVLDPGEFYGTVKMCGHVWGEAEHGGGMVQLDIMSTDKSADGADWTNASVDMTVEHDTLRTVLALDVMSSGEICTLNSVSGTIETEGGSSSVLNMSRHNAATLLLTGTRSGVYEGVFGYGDFQVAVNYGGYSENEQGATKHHYGAIGAGSLNVVKMGDSTSQTVRRAWLNQLEVQGGRFVVNEALVARDISSGDGKRVIVGAADPNTLYALAVGKGGVLAMNTTFAEEGDKVDAWKNIKAGVDGAEFVSLEDGATLSAREDWYTRQTIDLARNASVTVNTHNFIIDPYLKTEYERGNDVFGKYNKSHIIQLLGTMKGMDVSLTFNNRLIDPDTGAVSTSDADYIGYVAINDFNFLQGTENKVTVDSMTVLQVLKNNGGVEGDVDVLVEGRNATLQIVDKVVSYDAAGKGTTSDSMQQYIDHLVLGRNLEVDTTTDPLHRANNGQVLLGGAEVKTLAPTGKEQLTMPDMGDMQIAISTRHNMTYDELAGMSYSEAVKANPALAEKAYGRVEHLHVDLRGANASLGGAAGHQAEMANVHVDVARSDIGHKIHHTTLQNSLVHLMEDCAVNLADTVLLKADSVVRGVVVDYDAGTDAPDVGPAVASGNINTSKTKEVSTSVNTTVELTFNENRGLYDLGNSQVLVLQANQLLGVDVTGNGLTIQLTEDSDRFWEWGIGYGAEYVAVQIGGGSGHFLYETDNTSYNSQFENLLDSQFVLMGADGKQIEGYWISSVTVAQEVSQDGMPRAQVSMHMLYFRVPEPATATLSLAALVVLMGRRRRKD